MTNLGQLSGDFFNYHPLALGAALRMEFALIAHGFTHSPVRVGRNHAYLIFETALLTRTVRSPKALVNLNDLDHAISADVAIERAVRQFVHQVAEANAKLRRKGLRFHDWHA